MVTNRQYEIFFRFTSGMRPWGAITLRLDADLVVAAQVEAQQDSRTLINLTEIVLKRHLAGAGVNRSGPASGQDMTRGPEDAGAPAGKASGRQS
jgi:hypothetical protein